MMLVASLEVRHRVLARPDLTCRLLIFSVAFFVARFSLAAYGAACGTGRNQPRQLQRQRTPPCALPALVLPQYVQPAAYLYVVYPGARRQSARARLFIAFLTAHFAP